MNDFRSAFPLKATDIDETIRTFAQKFGRLATPEELACLEHARKLLSQRPAPIAEAGNIAESEETPSVSYSQQAIGTTEASG